MFHRPYLIFHSNYICSDVKWGIKCIVHLISINLQKCFLKYPVFKSTIHKNQHNNGQSH
jgi:hypothetical protein